MWGRVMRYVSRDPKTSYAPTWDFSIESITLPVNVEKLSKTCLEKEKGIKKLPLSYYNSKVFDGYTGLGKNSTTSRSSVMPNVLSWDTPETNSLKRHVKLQVKKYNAELGNSTPEHLWVRCWVNILKFGQKMKPHLHSVDPSCYLSAHFTIQAKDTSTCYITPANQINDPYIITHENKAGMLTIFPSYIPHYTTRHYSLEPRITLAMDIVTENWNGNWILL